MAVAESYLNSMIAHLFGYGKGFVFMVSLGRNLFLTCRDDGWYTHGVLFFR